MLFDRADPQDLDFLSQYNSWGNVPLKPLRLPGLGRYGRYQFDRHVLLQKNDLTIAQRREVLFLSAHFHQIDHFEFFELEPDADQRAIRKAFFHFTKRFHPDAVRSMNLGNFSEHVRLVFEYGQQAHELLTTDDAFREAYARVTALRDQSFRAELEKERASQHERVAEARSQGVLPPRDSRIGFAPTPQPTGHEPSREDAERKSMLRERLAQNQSRRRDASSHRQNSELDAQARTFFLSGEQAERRGQLARALNHFKLCVEYRPQDTRYLEALKRVETLIAEEISSREWEEATQMLESGEELQAQAAFDLFLSACQRSPNERRLIELTHQAIEQDRVTDALATVRQSAMSESFNLNLKWALVQLYEASKDLTSAKRLADEILSLDPSEPRATRFKKRYR